MHVQQAIRNANLLLLVTVVLVILPGSLAQRLDVGSGLIFTELVCILLPTLLLIRREGADWREAAAWRGARPEELRLAILIGFGAWALGTSITGLMIAFTGYQAPGLTPPESVAAGLVLFVALTVFAPVCEEILFRGYIFRAYALCGPRWAVVGSALLFAFYHLRLQGLPGLLPAAFALGVLRWRTGSLLPGVLAHAAQNSVSATILLLSALGVTLPDPLLMGIMLAMLLAGFVAFRRLLRLSPAPSAGEGERAARTGLGGLWPLIPFAAVYVLAAAAETGVISVPGAAPAVPAEPPALEAVTFERPQVWRYEIRNVADDVVGSMECRLTPEPTSYALRCTSANQAWRVEQGGSTFQSDATTGEIAIRWNRADLPLLELSDRVSWTESAVRHETRVEPAGDGLRLTVRVTMPGGASEHSASMALPAGAVLAQELPWRLSLAVMTEERTDMIALATPLKWNPESGTSAPAIEPVGLSLTRARAETGDAWQATLGDRLEAWYAADAPHTLLRFDYVGHSYRLVEQRTE